MSDQDKTAICISNPNHFFSLVEMMAKLRKEDVHTDVILQVDNVDFPAHKMVLALGSPFFERMFKDAYEENKMARITLCHETNPAIMVKVLDYIYSRPIFLGKDDCGLLLRNFDYFQMESAKMECDNVVLTMVDAGNCVEMVIVADQVGMRGLFTKASAVILNCFDQIKESDDIKRLTKAQFQTVLDIVSSRHPDAAYKSILAWVKYDETNRRPSFSELIRKYVHIQKILMDQQVFQDIGTEWLLRTVFKIKTPSMFIFSSNAQSPIYEFSPEKSTLSQFVNKAHSNNFSMAKYSNALYVIGGEANGRFADDGFKFDVNKKSWIRIKCPILRNQSGICVANDKMYIVGGWRDQFACKQFSYYDFETRILTTLPEMMLQRWSPGVVYINSSIYIFGGYPLQQDNSLKSTIERYDPREGKFSVAGEIPIEDRGCTAASFEDNIFYKGWNSSLYDFDPRNGLSKVLKEFSAFGTVSVSDGQLYVAHENGISRWDSRDRELKDVFLNSFSMPFIIA